MEEGDVFDLGNRTLEIIETPGHSPGSVSILDREHRWLFTGDTCCQADVLLQIEYSQSPEVYLKSINKLIERESQYDKHGRDIINGQLKRRLFINFMKLLRRL